MSMFFGKGYLVNPANPTLTPSGIAGYIAPVIRVPQLVQSEDAYSLLKTTLGIVEGIVGPNDCILKCTFNYLPRGTTLANALKAATLPTKGAYGIAGFPIIQVDAFADAWNATLLAGNPPWFYLGGGEILGAEDGKEWTGSITLWRFAGITSPTAITA